MFENQNRIIIVDNVQDELDQLGKSFFINGFGCRTFLYSQEYEEPLQNIRIAFFDINLVPGNPEITETDTQEILKQHSKVFNELAIAINQYISIDNGPYALIFWTKNSIVIEAFKLFMQNPRRGFNDTTARPIYIGNLDKVNPNEDNQTLSERVMQLLNKEEKIKFLFDFEENAKNAGEKTINRIYDILPKDDLWGETNVLYQNIDLVFSKISASTLGFKHAKENPKKALYEGLIPVLNYELINQESNIDWEKLLQSLINAQRYNEIKSPDPIIQHKVNSLFHIEDFINQDKDVRGCVIEIDKTNNNHLGNLNLNFNTWFNDLIPINDPTRRRYLREHSKLIAVEISAACDFSNRKDRINKYILGVITPDINYDKEVDSKRRSESSYHIGGCNFIINTLSCQIWLNLNYVFGAKADDERLGNPLFILKKEIMDMLGNKYAGHVSRIGITSF